MMDIDKLLNYLERKTADTAELQAASAITQLRSELQEAKEVIQLLREYMLKLACLGNGDEFGNSFGNCIAINALQDTEKWK